MVMVKRYPLLCYFFLAYLFSWAIEIPMLLEARGYTDMHFPHFLEALAGFGPFAAAVVVLWGTQGWPGIAQLLGSLIKWRVPAGWFLFTVASPFLVLLSALFITNESSKLFSGSICADLVASGRMIEMVVIGGLLRGIGEEPGWRGFALPVLRGRFGPLAATLALFPVWWIWHLPSFLMRPEFQFIQFFMFGLGILAAAVWCTLIFDATRSVLMIAIWHALINICRGFAGAASSEAFMAFAQTVLLVAVLVVIYWLLKRPGPSAVHDAPARG